MALTDLTRISTSGIATGSTIDAPILRKDISFRGSQVGVTSALFDSSDNALEFNDNVKLKLGNSGNVSFYSDGTNGILHAQNDPLYLKGDAVFIQTNNNEASGYFLKNGAVKLYFNGGDPKFETTNHGAVVTGILTATSFSGGGGISAGVVTCAGLDLNGNGDVSGNFVIGGDLTVNGTTTTLDTNLTEVDRIEVGANSNTLAGIAVTQSGSADIVRLYDGASQVVTVDDEGKIGLGTDAPSQKLHIEHNSFHQILLKRVGAGPSEAIFANAGNYTDIKNNASGVKFSVGSTPESKMVVRPVGVGIGTLLPRGDFHINDNNPALVFSESDAAVDNKYWRTHINGQTWTWDGLNDSLTSGDNNFRMTRNGNQITAFQGRVSGSTWFNVSNSTQRVGIGSDTPGQKLDVSGTILTRSNTNTATFSYNTLRFQTSGGAHIDHGTTNQNLNFRVSKSSAADTTMVQINAASEQTKFRKVVTVGLQGGSDTTVIGGGSGIGAYLQLNYASGGIVNTKLLGNNNSWLNSHYGNLGIGTQTATRKLQVTSSSADPYIKIGGSNRDCGLMLDANNEFIALRTDAADRLWVNARSDGFYFTVGGTSSANAKLRIDSSGRLGLNQSTPASRLHISEAGSNTITIQLTNATTGHTAGTDGMTMGYSTNSSAGFINVCESGSAFTIKTGGTAAGNERLRIRSDGNVDINGTPPWTVSGGNFRNLSISGEGASASGFLWLGNGAATNNADFDLGRINFLNGGTIVARVIGTTDTSANDDGVIRFNTKKTGETEAERLRIDSYGALLVGTTTPLYTGGDMRHEIRKDATRGYTAQNMVAHSHLLINNSNTGTDRFSSIGFRAGTGDGAIGFVYGNSANNADFVVVTDGGANGTERLRIKSGGDHIQNGGYYYLNNPNGSIFFDNNTGGYGGNAGIGIAQATNYHVNGTSPGDLVMAAKNQKKIIFATAPNNSGGISASSGGIRMQISKDGNVTKPSQPRAHIKISGSPALANHKITTWATPEYNVGDIWDETNSRFVAPTDGLYMIGGNFRIGAPGKVRVARFNLQVYNTSNTLLRRYGGGTGGGNNYDGGSTGYDHPYVSFTNIIFLNNGEYVELHTAEVGVENTSYIQTSSSYDHSNIWCVLLQ